MDAGLQKEFNKDMNAIVDIMVQMDSMRESLAELKKAAKAKYDIPVATITKVVTILRKESLDDEDEKWASIKEYVEICS